MRRAKGFNFWTPEEDAVLRENYFEHGSMWEGYADLLPGRNYRAIRYRAHFLGLRNKKSVPKAKKKRIRTDVRKTDLTPDPYEYKIFTLHSKGLTCSQIDEQLNLRMGMARQIMSYRWERERYLEERRKERR